MAVSVACRGVALWAVAAVNTVTLAAIVLSAWSSWLWNRKRNADHARRRTGDTMTEFRFARDAADERFAQWIGGAVVLALAKDAPRGRASGSSSRTSR